MNEFQLIDI